MSKRLIVSALTLSLCLGADALGEPIVLSHEKTALDMHIRHLVVEDFNAQVDDVLSDLDEFERLPEGVPNLGFSTNAHWFSVEVKNPGKTGYFVFENQYAPLDQLDVFLLRGPEILESVKGGEVRLLKNALMNTATLTSNLN